MARMFLCGALAGLVVSVAALAAADASPAGTELSVRYRFTVRNRSAAEIADAEVRVFAPLERTSTQWTRIRRASQPYTIETDGHGNRVLVFLLDLAPHQSAGIAVDAGVERVHDPVPLWSMEREYWLRAARFVEVDDPLVHAAAAGLAGSTADEIARSAMDFVAGAVRMERYVAEDRGAVAALASGTGDCTESMYLFVALLRGRGVPARGVEGFVLRGSAVLRADALHNWTEFHDGTTWRVVDPQRRVFDPQGEHYLAMHVLGAEPSPLMQGARRSATAHAGLEVRME